MLPASQAISSNLVEYNQQNNRVTNLLDIPRQKSKDQTGTIIPVFGILINFNTFVASLPPEKIAKAVAATKTVLSAKSLMLKEAQSLTGYLFYCAKVVELGWVFTRLFWTLVAIYPQKISSLAKRRLLLEVRNNLTWWNTLLSILTVSCSWRLN